MITYSSLYSEYQSKELKLSISQNTQDANSKSPKIRKQSNGASDIPRQRDKMSTIVKESFQQSHIWNCLSIHNVRHFCDSCTGNEVHQTECEILAGNTFHWSCISWSRFSDIPSSFDLFLVSSFNTRQLVCRKWTAPFA